MSAEPLEAFGAVLHRPPAAGSGLRCADGRWIALDAARWHAPADAADVSVLDRCSGPVLDVGCGPGRLVAALAERGVPVLGVDVAPAAVALTLATGGAVLQRSVFSRLPGEGRWETVLLLDGNVGIGGAPDRLLGRVRELLGPHGAAIVEVEAEDVDERLAVRLQHPDGSCSAPFPWARVGAAALGRTAQAVGLRPATRWSAGGRCFARLLRAG